MSKSSHCAWCNATIGATKIQVLSNEGVDIFCCSESCASSRKHADESNFKALILLSSAHLKSGISPAAAETHYVSMEPVSTAEKIEVIERTLFQICEGKGMLPDDPLKEVGVEGLAATMRLLGLVKAGRQTQHNVTIGQSKGALDQMQYIEQDQGQTYQLFNFCAAPPRDEPEDWTRELLND